MTWPRYNIVECPFPASFQLILLSSSNIAHIILTTSAENRNHGIHQSPRKADHGDCRKLRTFSVLGYASTVPRPLSPSWVLPVGFSERIVFGPSSSLPRTGYSPHSRRSASPWVPLSTGDTSLPTTWRYSKTRWETVCRHRQIPSHGSNTDTHG